MKDNSFVSAYLIIMIYVKRRILIGIALACLILPVSAASFDELLSSFRVITPPETWGCDPHVWGGMPDNPSISIGDFETLFLAPARNLAAHRTGLRSLEEWEGLIHSYRENIIHPEQEVTKTLGFYPLGQWKDHGFLILALYFYNEDHFFEGADVVKRIFLFSFTPSGRMIDGFSFLPPQVWAIEYPLRPAVPPLKHALQDPVFHQGYPDKATITLDTQNRIIALERYQIDDMITEIGKREIGISSDGAFVDLAPKRRFLLTKIFGELDGKPGLLFDYEPEEGEKGNSAFLIWKASSDGEYFETEVPIGKTPPNAVTARDPWGTGNAAFTDAAGVTHPLVIKYGPGKNGEATQLSGRMHLGDHNTFDYLTWTYLFAPTPFPVAKLANPVLLADRSLALSTVYEIIPHAESEEGTKKQVESSGNEVAAGMVAEGFPWYLFASPVSFSPRSFRFFQDYHVAGMLTKDVKLQWEGGSVSLAAGTSCLEGDLYGRGWVVPVKDTVIMANSKSLKVPAGSTIRRLNDPRPKSIAFAKPVTLAVGSASITIYSVEFALEPSYRLSGATPVGSASMLVKGKSIMLTGSLSFDQSGKLQGGRLQANTDFTVGGKTLGFRGGYDTNNPDWGIIQFYQDGSVQSGYLSNAAIFQVGKSRLSLVAGDHVSFKQDGGLKSFSSSAILKLTSGSTVSYIRDEELFCEPDGRIISRKFSTGETLAPGGAYVASLIATCNDSSVRIRERGSTEAAKLGLLKVGDKVEVLVKSEEPMNVEDMTDYWYCVRRLSDGLTGWCYGHYLMLEE